MTESECVRGFESFPRLCGGLSGLLSTALHVPACLHHIGAGGLGEQGITVSRLSHLEAARLREKSLKCNHSLFKVTLLVLLVDSRTLFFEINSPAVLSHPVTLTSTHVMRLFAL